MFLWQLKKEGYQETTIKQNYAKILKHLIKYSDIKNPDAILDSLARKKCSEGRKEIIADIYAKYCRYVKIPFAKPRYTRVDSIPHVPIEKNVEALLGVLPHKLSIFTRMVFETGAKPGEAFALRWKDIDLENCTVDINKPEKGSRARRLKISKQLAGLLSTIRRACEFVFRSHPNAKIEAVEPYFLRERKKIANAQCNPKLQLITWKSLRHYKGSSEYHKTRDILHVKQILGHVNIQNTLIYTHLIDFENEEYVCKVGTSIEECTKLIEAGFE